MSQPIDWSHLCHLKTCIWMIVALIHTGSVNLTEWSMYIPCRSKFAQSRQRRIQRWLNNPRIKSNTWIWRGNWCQPKNFHLNLGEAICLHNVQIHQGEFYGTVHVIIGRNNINGELWAIVSDEETTLQTFAEYGCGYSLV
jgi:hypothetical protein